MKLHMMVRTGVLAVTVVGCSGRSADVGYSSSELVIPSMVFGYHHALERSLFKPGRAGDPISTISDMGFTKSVGSNGVFAVDEANGWVIATPNGGAPSTMRPPYPGNADNHNSRVLSYFLAAGIPKNQIGSVYVHSMMQGGMSSKGVRTPDQLVGYYSLLARVINGVLVSESTASARFNVDGDVVEESVWPDLPGTVISDANAISSAMAGRSDSIPRQNMEKFHAGFGGLAGTVMIHHGDSTYHGPAYTIATYDIPPAERGAGVTHFDKNGGHVVLASESTSSVPSSVPGLPRIPGK